MNGLFDGNDLTERQKRLYTYLIKEFDKDPFKWLQLWDIYVDMHLNEFDDYPCGASKVNWNNHPARRELTKDIQKLKKSASATYMVLSDHRGCKIGLKTETPDTLISRRISLLNSLKLNWDQFKKSGLDGQFSFAYNNGKGTYEVFRKHPEIEEVS